MIGELFAKDMAVTLHKLRRITKSDRAEKGQSLVEFTFSLLVILIIISGLLDLGRLYYIYVALEDSAGEAALYLSINAHCRSEADTDFPNDVDCMDPNNATYRARHSSTGIVEWALVDPSFCVRPYGVDICSEIWDDADIVIGSAVQVTIRYGFEPVTPFITRMAGFEPIMLTVEAAQTIVYQPN
jgi:hypothetical protein